MNSINVDIWVNGCENSFTFKKVEILMISCLFFEQNRICFIFW